MELTFKRFKSSNWLPNGRIRVRLQAVVRDEKAAGTKSKPETVNLIFSSSAELQAFAQSALALEPLPPGVASNEMMMQEAARAARRRRR